MLLFGVAEAATNLNECSVEIDNQTATEIILKVLPEAVIDNVKTFRVGHGNSSKPRPT